MFPYILSPLAIPNNDGWQDGIQAKPLCYIRSWPIVSLPPPPPEENLSHHP